MVGPETAEVLIAVRLVATGVFLDLYLQERRRENLVLSGAWFLFLLSAVARLLVSRGTFGAGNAAAVFAIGATALLVLATLTFVDARYHKPTAPLFVVTLLLAIPALALPEWTISPPAALTAQAVLLAVLFWVLVRRKRLPIPLTPRAVRALTAVIVLGIAQMVLMVTGVLTVAGATMGTASINIVLILFFVFTDHTRTLVESRTMEQHLKRAEKVAGIGYWERNAVTDEAVWSPGHYEIFGMNPWEDPPSLEEYLQFVHPDDRERVLRVWKDLSAGSITPLLEYRIHRRDGAERWLSAETALDEAGDRHYGLIHDITRLKHSERRLEEALGEKTVLLSEIHHRVKNNLQVILSLIQLKLHAEESEHGENMTRESLLEIEERIRSMAAVHEHLVATGNLLQVSLDSYLSEIASQVFSSVAPLDRTLRLECSMDSVTTSVDTALPCGLITAELVTNACRHAFPPSRPEGCISVSLHASDAQIELSVRDNGIGLDPSAVSVADPAEGRLGLEFVRSFVGQLKGQLDLYGSGGTAAVVRFPR